jgi:low affinity Fe/Cu permease
VALAGYLCAMDRHTHRSRLSRFVQTVTAAAGSVTAAAIAASALLGWAVVGLVAGFSDRWNAVLWSVTSAVTLLMVFVIQHAANRESRAILLKLDELIRSQHDARDALIGVEQRSVIEQESLERQMQQHAGTGG